ncbi:MAG: hypothetical protein KF866_10375 [Phycisphaeraceae bacterium]|nr:hypothetical protein [Phycisphaeraceae bacterium]MCW5754907.1 hypothetical protein [Phycisphaeraceae bacterium]
MKRTRKFAPTIAAMLILSCGTARMWADPGPDDWIELPVVINLYKGVNVTEDEAKGYIERANEVLKQAKIKLKVAKTNTDFEVGNGDANQAETEDAEAIKKGKEELKDHTEGKGIKINFCNQPIDGRPGTNGWAIHKTPVVFVRKNSDAEKEKEKTGNTVAHEICHVLTIDYDLYDAEFIKRLMYGRDSRTGTELTDAEKEEIRKEAAKRGKVEKKEAPAAPSQNKKQETALGYNSSDDSPNDVSGVKDASITSLEGDESYEMRLVLGGAFAPGQSGNYYFLLDTDNNPDTGVIIGDIVGIERAVQIFVPPGAPFAQISAFDTLNPSNTFNTMGTVILEHKFYEGDDGAPVGSTPYGHVIDWSIPIAFFEPAPSDLVSVIVGAGPMGAPGFDRFTMILDRFAGDRGPHVSTDVGLVDAAAGEAFVIFGSEFTPGAVLEVTLDDALIGAVVADPAGNFTMLMTLDPATPTDAYFLTVQDPADGAFGFAVIEVIGLAGCPADLSGAVDPNDPNYGVPDGVVDAADFFYYLDQFVAGNLAVADLTGSVDPNDPSYGVPDGMLDAADFFYYLDLFVAGCP